MAYDDPEDQTDDAPDDAREEASETDAQEAQEVHARAIEAFDAIIQAVQDERAEALQDRRFVSIAGAQWEGLWGEQFENVPRVEVNRTARAVEKILGDYRANRVTVNFRGVGPQSSDHTADLLDGLFRADLYNSKGQQAIDNAFEEAVQGGYGAFRLCNIYDDELDPDNDHQRISFEAIPDADQSVFFDLDAKLYDKSDARHCFVLCNMSRGAFEREYGSDRVTSWPEGIQKPFYDWFTPDTVAVAEYYEVREVEALLRIFKHKATDEERREWADDLTRQAFADIKTEGWVQQRTRKAKRRQVVKYVLSGAEVLDGPQTIAGPNIPVIPVYGKRWFIDKMERARGEVRFAKDPQRIYNGQVSSLMESASQSPAEVPIFAPSQVAGLETHWAEANLHRHAYRLANPLVDETTGQIVTAGPIGTVSPPQVPPVMAALIQLAGNDIDALTGADDNTNQVQSNVSADAMDIAATRSDTRSAIYIDNLRTSLQRAGEVYEGMAREVYFEPGREVVTMDAEGSPASAELAEPFTDPLGKFQVRHDLTKGKYLVIADVQEATATRRDKTVKGLISLAQVTAQTNPELAGMAGATAALNMDGEGMDDLKAWIRQKLVQAGVIPPNEQEKAELEQQQQNQQPDPTAQAMQAQGELFQAQAEKAKADTDLSRAKTVETLANAHKVTADATHTHAQTHATHVDTLGKLTTPPAQPAAAAQPKPAPQMGFAPPHQPARPSLAQRVRGFFGR